MKWAIVVFAVILGAGLGAGMSARAETPEPDTQSQDEPTPGRQNKLPPVTQECMFFRTIYDWRALDPYNLIVWFNNRHTARHIELETACFSARFVDTIAFTSRDNELCAFGGDSVIIGDMQCAIGAIHKLGDEDVEALIEKFESHYKNRKSKKKDAAGDTDGR